MDNPETRHGQCWAEDTGQRQTNKQLRKHATHQTKTGEQHGPPPNMEFVASKFFCVLKFFPF